MTETNEEALERLRALAKRRILETLGLARRSGMLEMGSDRVAENLKTCMDMGESGVALRAEESHRGRRALHDGGPIARHRGERGKLTEQQPS